MNFISTDFSHALRRFYTFPCFFFFFKQKTAYEMVYSDWSSDVCSSDLLGAAAARSEAGCRRSALLLNGDRRAPGDLARAPEHLPRRRRQPLAAVGHARAALLRCCGATRWAGWLLTQRPFASTDALFKAAAGVWTQMEKADMLEAFSHHPEIGSDLAALRERFASTAAWSSAEQAGVAGADDATLEALRDGNVRYRERFGYVFLVCATGKTAAEMLALLRARLAHD